MLRPIFSKGSKVAGSSDKEIAELNAADAARAAVREQSKETGFQLLLHWNNTIFQYVVCDSQIYLSIAVYFITVHFLQTGEIVISKSGGTAIKVITCLTSMMTFLLVFYLNESYRRYNAQHLCQCKLRTRINSIAIFICSRSAKGETSKLRAAQIMRYLNAAQVIGYTSVTESYTEENFCWPIIRKYKLLTDNEISSLSNIAIDHDSVKNIQITKSMKGNKKKVKYGSKVTTNNRNMYIQGAAFRKVLMWVTDNVIEMVATKSIGEKDGGYVLRFVGFLNEVMNELFDYQYLNVPFCYANILAVFIFFYCLMFAFAVATTTVTYSNGIAASTNTDIYYGMFVVIFSNTFINGLYILARMLQDPFGKDSVDLSVNDYVELCINSSNMMVKEMGTTPIFDMETELSLLQSASQSTATNIETSTVLPDSMLFMSTTSPSNAIPEVYDTTEPF